MKIFFIVRFKQSGFILLTSLLFIFVISLLVFNIFENSQIHNRFNAYQREAACFVYTANHILKLTEQEFATSNFKVDDFFPPIADATDIWWQQHGRTLSVEEFDVKYYIDTLFTNPCMQIQNEKYSGARFYRITLKIRRNQQDDLLLQTIYARSMQSDEVCQRKVTMIKPGQQSWHLLT